MVPRLHYTDQDYTAQAHAMKVAYHRRVAQHASHSCSATQCFRSFPIVSGFPSFDCHATCTWSASKWMSFPTCHSQANRARSSSNLNWCRLILERKRWRVWRSVPNGILSQLRFRHSPIVSIYANFWAFGLAVLLYIKSSCVNEYCALLNQINSAHGWLHSQKICM